MVALQIRDVPEEWRDTLAAAAEARGQSLQSYLFDLLGDEVRRQQNVAVIQRFAGRRFGSQATGTEIIDHLRAARVSREDRDVGGTFGEQETGGAP